MLLPDCFTDGNPFMNKLLLAGLSVGCYNHNSFGLGSGRALQWGR